MAQFSFVKSAADSVQVANPQQRNTLYSSRAERESARSIEFCYQSYLPLRLSGGGGGEGAAVAAAAAALADSDGQETIRGTI